MGYPPEWDYQRKHEDSYDHLKPEPVCEEVANESENEYAETPTKLDGDADWGALPWSNRLHDWKKITQWKASVTCRAVEPAQRTTYPSKHLHL